MPKKSSAASTIPANSVPLSDLKRAGGPNVVKMRVRRNVATDAADLSGRVSSTTNLQKVSMAMIMCRVVFGYATGKLVIKSMAQTLLGPAGSGTKADHVAEDLVESLSWHAKQCFT